MIPNITLFDLSIGLGYLFIIYYFMIKWQKKGYQNNHLYKYFVPALTIKIIGGLAFSIISIYYYQKGDTFLYFQLSENLRSHLFIDFWETINSVFTSYSEILL